MDRLLITGGSGLLGANAVLAAVDKYDVAAVYHRQALWHPQVHTTQANLTNADQAAQVIQEIRPQVILHCAALTNIDQCDLDPAAALLHNRDMTAVIAQNAQKIGAYLIHISTDAIFNGIDGDYVEEEEPAPINAYAESKAAAEQVVLTYCPHSAIIRTNFYGWNAQSKLSLAEWFLQRLQAGEQIPGFDDVWFSPILVNHLIDIIFKISDRRLVGIYHVAGGECVSKYQFGVRIAEIFNYEPERISAVSIASVGLEAARSKMLCLNSGLIARKLGIEMPTLDEGLFAFKALEHEGYPGKLQSLMSSDPLL